MIVGRITVQTCHGEADIPVEVLGKGPRPGTMWVKALNGLQPFVRMSHGGPCQENTALVSTRGVRDIAGGAPSQKAESQPAAQPQCEETSPAQAEDWFLESLYEDRNGSEPD